MAQQDGNFFDGLFNTATNVFDRFLEFEIQKEENERLAEIRKLEDRAAQQEQREFAGQPQTRFVELGMPAGVSQQALIAGSLALVSIAALVIFATN